MSHSPNPIHRAIALGPHEVDVRHDPNGTIYLTSRDPLGPYPRTLTERLAYWARERPEQVFLAKRETSGGPCRA